MSRGLVSWCLFRLLLSHQGEDKGVGGNTVGVEVGVCGTNDLSSEVGTLLRPFSLNGHEESRHGHEERGFLLFSPSLINPTDSRTSVM